MSDPKVAARPASAESQFELVEATRISGPAPINRKLASGTGLGVPVTVIFVAILKATTGYAPSVEEVAAIQAIFSFAIGWAIREAD